MTPADLEARGLRVKPLVWDAHDYAHTTLSSYSVHDYGGTGFFSCLVLNGGSRNDMLVEHTDKPAAIAAANAHHAAQVAAMIEVIG